MVQVSHIEQSKQCSATVHFPHTYLTPCLPLEGFQSINAGNDVGGSFARPSVLEMSRTQTQQEAYTYSNRKIP